jgi:hypothetical protein
MRVLVLAIFLLGAILSGVGCGGRDNEPVQTKQTGKGRLQKIKPPAK